MVRYLAKKLYPVLLNIVVKQSGEIEMILTLYKSELFIQLIKKTLNRFFPVSEDSSFVLVSKKWQEINWCFEVI